MIRRLGMCFSSSYTLVGWHQAAAHFLLHGSVAVVLVLSLSEGRGGKGQGALYSLIRQCESLCVCISLPRQTQSTLLTHTRKHSKTDRREEFRLPMSAPSIKLIRLRAPDNSIISHSFDNRKPLTTAKAPATQYYQTLLYFLILPADKSKHSRLAQCLEGKAAHSAWDVRELKS